MLHFYSLPYNSYLPICHNIQMQLTLQLTTHTFRLPESVYDGLNLPNQYTHLLPLPNNSQKPITQRRELHIPLDADIDDFASTQDDLYAQKDEVIIIILRGNFY